MTIKHVELKLGKTGRKDNYADLQAVPMRSGQVSLLVASGRLRDNPVAISLSPDDALQLVAEIVESVRKVQRFTAVRRADR